MKALSLHLLMLLKRSYQEEVLPKTTRALHTAVAGRIYWATRRRVEGPVEQRVLPRLGQEVSP